MAGSLAHILNDNGTFRGTDLLNTLDGDGYAALAECHQIIAELLDICVETVGVDSKYGEGIRWTDKRAILKLACDRLGFPVPSLDNCPSFLDPDPAFVVVPVIEPGLHGHASVYRKVVEVTPGQSASDGTIEVELTLPAVPGAVIINGVRFEPAQS